MVTFSLPVEQNIAEGFASCSLSFNKLLPKAKYMKRPLAAAVMFLYSSVGSVRIDEIHSKSTANLDISMNTGVPQSTSRVLSGAVLFSPREH